MLTFIDSLEVDDNLLNINIYPIPKIYFSLGQTFILIETSHTPCKEETIQTMVISTKQRVIHTQTKTNYMVTTTRIKINRELHLTRDPKKDPISNENPFTS